MRFVRPALVLRSLYDTVMALNNIGSEHVAIALRILAGTITKVDEIHEEQRYFLTETGEHDIKEAAVQFLTNHLSRVLGDG